MLCIAVLCVMSVVNMCVDIRQKKKNRFLVKAQIDMVKFRYSTPNRLFSLMGKNGSGNKRYFSNWLRLYKASIWHKSYIFISSEENLIEFKMIWLFDQLCCCENCLKWLHINYHLAYSNNIVNLKSPKMDLKNSSLHWFWKLLCFQRDLKNDIAYCYMLTWVNLVLLHQPRARIFTHFIFCSC